MQHRDLGKGRRSRHTGGGLVGSSRGSEEHAAAAGGGGKQRGGDEDCARGVPEGGGAVGVEVGRDGHGGVFAWEFWELEFWICGGSSLCVCVCVCVCV